MTKILISPRGDIFIYLIGMFSVLFSCMRGPPPEAGQHLGTFPSWRRSTGSGPSAAALTGLQDEVHIGHLQPQQTELPADFSIITIIPVSRFTWKSKSILWQSYGWSVRMSFRCRSPRPDRPRSGHTLVQTLGALWTCLTVKHRVKVRLGI